jgi:hypothetical protein
MYHYNRYKRPSWATGTFVALGCIVAGVGGLMMFHEGKYAKKVEGVPAANAEREEDVEAQVTGPNQKQSEVVGEMAVDPKAGNKKRWNQTHSEKTAWNSVG